MLNYWYSAVSNNIHHWIAEKLLLDRKQDGILDSVQMDAEDLIEL